VVDCLWLVARPQRAERRSAPEALLAVKASAARRVKWKKNVQPSERRAWL